MPFRFSGYDDIVAGVALFNESLRMRARQRQERPPFDHDSPELNFYVTELDNGRGRLNAGEISRQHIDDAKKQIRDEVKMYEELQVEERVPDIVLIYNQFLASSTTSPSTTERSIITDWFDGAWADRSTTTTAMSNATLIKLL